METIIKRNYWVVSPNVLNDGPEKWIKLVNEQNKAFIGWGDDNKFGLLFKNEVKEGDFVLIAQGANRNKRVYFGGIVASERERDEKERAYFRHLTNTLSKEDIESISLNFENAAYGDANLIPSIYKLKPEINKADKAIVLKIERLLKSEKRNFLLKEIADWQENIKFSSVKLPAVQRGFVWKVNQIETLWDSILRGYPIGSFLLSRQVDDHLKMMKLFLLDGQQRATSIFMGYNNPWVGKNHSQPWELKSIPILWVDLNPLRKMNNHKFVIRVVTQAHPWGYQRENNLQILSVSDRRNALKIFRDIDEEKAELKGQKEKSYIQLDLKNVFPYDSDVPVPLSFLIELSKDSDEKNWKENLMSMCEKYLACHKIKTKLSKNLDYLEGIKNCEDNSVWEAIQNLKKFSIPSIMIEEELLKTDEDDSNEDPTLFVRLNSAGTRIGGEELIYSIYKASFPSVKDLVEEIGATFISPSRVISLATRLIIAEQESRFPRLENVNSFRKRLQNLEFKNRLKEFIGKSKGNSEANVLFQKAVNILSNLQYSIPPVLIKSIIQNEPDVFLMLLQWLKLNDKFPITEEYKKNVLATVTCLAWFGNNNMKFVSNAWVNIASVDFWQKFKQESIKNGELFYPLIKPEDLRSHLVQTIGSKMDWVIPSSEIKNHLEKCIVLNSEDDTESNRKIDKMWLDFRSRLVRNRALILFAQRKYINERFQEFNQMETLDDTNVPWDWDHIYPSSWIDYQRYIAQRSRNWNNCIGNLRALSLEENRSEGNLLSPSKRLSSAELEQDEINEKPDFRFSNKIKEQSFIMDLNPNNEKNDWKFWNQINSEIKDDNEIGIQQHLSAITTRMCNIYEEWYETLGVSQLFD